MRSDAVLLSMQGSFCSLLACPGSRDVLIMKISLDGSCLTVYAVQEYLGELSPPLLKTHELIHGLCRKVVEGQLVHEPSSHSTIYYPSIAKQLSLIINY